MAGCWHYGKTKHKKDSCWKKFLKLIPDQYKLKKDEILLTPLKKSFISWQKMTLSGLK